MPPSICIGCGQPFPANQAIAGRCRSCIRQSSQPVTQLLDQDPGRFQYISTRNPDLSWTVLRIIIAIVVIVGLALFKFGMRESMRNDYREANGVHTYEDYSR
ncbi:MAG TPA: hypothetical protein VFQ53_33195 [Kofleriaceae bacterium]|nr:hypothetical protein [Kofleriaceae bacterium]